MGGAISKSVLAEQNVRLLEETQEMKRQLETRKLVERAKGILQNRYTLTEEEAYLRLRNESRRLRRPMRDLAEAIILSEDLSRKSDSPPMPAMPRAV
jgi:AmiR/NasT family two-component response regulator